MKRISQILKLKELKIGAFLVCLGISTLIWLFLQLSEASKSVVRFKVNYNNVEKGYVLAKKLPEFIDVEVEAHGFSLLNVELSDKIQTLDVDLSQMIYRENKDEKNTIWTTSSTISSFSKQINADVLIKKIYPDTIHIQLSKKFYKSVPAKFEGELTFEDQYILHQLSIHPDSIIISGPKHLLKTINYLPVKTNFQSINEDMLQKAKVLNPSDLVQVETKEVEVKVAVDLIQKSSMKVPVKVINMPNGYELKLFPASIEIEFIGGRKSMEKITSKDFKLYVNFDEITDYQIDQELPLILESYPENLSKIALKTSKVAYKLSTVER